MFWRIDRTFKMTYTKLSDRSVETCEAYRRGESLRVSPSFVLRGNAMQTPKKSLLQSVMCREREKRFIILTV